MNISYNWLNEIVDSGLDPQQVADQLTRVGLAVEGVHPHGDDFVLDIDLTSNRPDCLSHRGIGRELSAVLDNAMIDREVSAVPSSDAGLVEIEDADLCNRFTARVIRNVKVGPSPQWLVDRLEAIGERSINNVADITNYVMHELGQPMHAFDLDKLSGGRIVVRRARSGEKIQTLDEVERVLDTDMLTICDAESPVAIGGVMGGLESSITDATVNVLLEVAYFDRGNIRATSRKLNLATEASYRFERGTDVLNLVRASERAADLIRELAGGEKAEFVDIFAVPFVPRSFLSNDIAGAVKRLTGLSVDRTECIRILNALGIGSSQNEDGSLTFTAPSWRHDIAIEEDLVEEIARHAGYEKIAEELPPAFGAGEYQPTERRERRLRARLADLGCVEALSYSFIDERHDGVFEIVPGIIGNSTTEPYVTLRDSVIEGALRMRPSILPGLLDSVRTNLNHKRRDLKLFEIGKVFSTGEGEEGLPNEQKLLTIVMTGSESLSDRAKPGNQVEFFDIKGGLEAALDAVGCYEAVYRTANVKHLRIGQAAAVSVGEVEIGHLGRLDDELAAGYKFKQPVYVAEINLTTVLKLPTANAAYKPLPRFPSVVRDVSFIVDRTFAFDSIRTAITEQANDLCRKVSFVDNFEGKDGDRSLTIRLEYRSDERTLVEEEVEAVHASLLKGVEQKLQIRPQM